MLFMQKLALFHIADPLLFSLFCVRFAFVNELIRKAGDFPFPVYCTSLEHALESHFRPEFVKSCGDGGQYCLPSKTSTGQLRRLLDGTSELSAKEALQRHLRRRVREKKLSFSNTEVLQFWRMSLLFRCCYKSPKCWELQRYSPESRPKLWPLVSCQVC